MLCTLGFNNTVHAAEHVDSNSTKSIGGYNNKVFYISNNTGHSEEPQIIKNENNIYILWIDDTSGSRNIYFKKSSDNGCTFSPTIDLGIRKGGSLDPKMMVSGNYVYVIWEYTPENNGMIFWTRSTDNGASFETVKNLSNNTGFNGFPQMAISGNKVYATWHDATNGIIFVRSTDNGASFETVKNLSNKSGFNGFPQIAATGNDVYVAWTNNAQEKYGQIILTRSMDNGASFESPFLIHKAQENGVNSTVFSPKIAVGYGDNSVYLVWHSGRFVEHGRVTALISDVIFTRSTDKGASFDEITNLSNYSGWAVDPQIVVSSDNGVYVVWTNNVTGNEEIILKDDVRNANECVSSNSTDKLINVELIRNHDTISGKGKNIAVVDATFTRAAYDKSFYMFYEIYDENAIGKDIQNFTNYTSLLSSRVDDNIEDWSVTHQIVNHLKWLTPKSTIDLLGDDDVHNGSSLFSANGTNLYDVIMLQHQEYVSQQEYDNLKKFVSNGGILMLLNGNVFYGEVEYDENTTTIKFVKGHNFAFNGETAWRSVRERWMEETSEWTGGNYKCCFAWEFIFRNDPFGITHVEEQYITNPKAKILLDYNATVNRPDPGEFIIATYELEYKKGKVITLGLYMVNKLIENERFQRFFDSLLFRYALGD